MKIATLVFLFLVTLAPVCGASEIQWFTDTKAAIAESERTGKPIFVDAYADWCSWCVKLDEDVYTDARFIEFMKQFVPLKLDVDDEADGTQFAEDYAVSALPTLMIINSKGHVVHSVEGYLPAEELITELKSCLNESQNRS
jgi:thiol:disulfide interchange protein